MTKRSMTLSKGALPALAFELDQREPAQVI
jgi:hypothetical protein